MMTSNSIAYRGLPAILVIQGAFSLPMFFLMRFRTFFNNWFICSLVTIDTWVLSSKKKWIIIFYWYLQCSLSFIPYTTYVWKVPRMNVLQTNEYLARSVYVGLSRIITILLCKFSQVLTCTTTCWNGSWLCHMQHFHGQFIHTNRRAKSEH
jgi:hypothetical protein